MILNELRKKMIEFYNIKSTDEDIVDINKKNRENIIINLLFIIDYLNSKQYTLTHICLSDFVMIDEIILLKHSTHLVQLDDNFYFRNVYENSNNEDSIEFPTKELKRETRVSLKATYESIGLFIYYLYFGKIKDEIHDSDIKKIEGTKPYYFIKNTNYKFPYIIYL